MVNVFKRVVVPILAVLALTLAAVLVCPSSASAKSESQEHGDVKVIKLLAKEAESTFDGTTAPKLGDGFALSDNLYRKDKLVGYDGVSCTFVSLERMLVHCTGALVLTGRGQITIQGLISEPEEFTVAVTGGTDEFLGATGQLHVKNMDPQRNESRLTITLKD